MWELTLFFTRIPFFPCRCICRPSSYITFSFPLNFLFFPNLLPNGAFFSFLPLTTSWVPSFWGTLIEKILPRSVPPLPSTLVFAFQEKCFFKDVFLLTVIANCGSFFSEIAIVFLGDTLLGGPDSSATFSLLPLPLVRRRARFPGFYEWGALPNRVGFQGIFFQIVVPLFFFFSLPPSWRSALPLPAPSGVKLSFFRERGFFH